MRITRETEYALRIVLMLAREQKQIEAKAIAESNNIPYRFTLKILRKIVQAGIIRSHRGVNGGYILNRRPCEISVLDVIRCSEGEISLDSRSSTDEPSEDSYAHTINVCLKSVQDKLERELGDLTFDKVSEMHFPKLP